MKMLEMVNGEMVIVERKLYDLREKGESIEDFYKRFNEEVERDNGRR